MNSVLFLIERLTIGGQQTYMLNILQKIPNFNVYTAFFIDGPLRKNFDEISIKSFKINPDSMNLKYYAYRPWAFLKVLLMIRNIVKEENIKLIITNGFLSYFFGCMVKLIVNIKVVRFIGADLVRNESFHFVKRFHKFPLHKLTDLFFGYEDILKQIECKGVNKAKLVYSLGNLQAVDTNLFFPMKDRSTDLLATKLNLDRPNNIIIGWHGRIHYDKEIMHTIEMLKVLKIKKFNQFKFLIVGDGATIHDIKKELKQAGLFEKSVFTGMVSYFDINKYYSITDVEVLLDYDPIGGSHVREAMACGKCVITTNGKSGFQGTWIENERTGYLVSPQNMYEETADIIIKLHKNKEILKEIGQNGSTYAKKYLSFKNVAKIFESECISILRQ